VQEIDAAMRLGTNYPQGPLAWADDIGIDVVLFMLDALHTEYRQERYRACRLLRKYVALGWIGKSVGKGFYEYDDE
jgi:3-hydroxybutyryl-CoA dehydrogenase